MQDHGISSSMRLYDRVRQSLLNLAELTAGEGFEAILMQGSGTFGVESVICVGDSTARSAIGTCQWCLW